MPTLFEKIITREIPSKIIYEDAQCIAIQDIHPAAPAHVLIIPKRCIPRINAAQESDAPLLGHLLTVAPKLAQKLGVDQTGYRLIINNGKDAGETVPHLHVHLLGGRDLGPLVASH